MAWMQNAMGPGELLTEIGRGIGAGQAALLHASATETGALTTKSGEVEVTFDCVVAARTTTAGASLPALMLANPNMPLVSLAEGEQTARQALRATIRLSIVQVPWEPGVAADGAVAVIGDGILRGGNEAAGLLRDAIARLRPEQGAALAALLEAAARGDDPAASPPPKDRAALIARLAAMAGAMRRGDRPAALALAELDRTDALALAQLRRAGGG